MSETTLSEALRPASEAVYESGRYWWPCPNGAWVNLSKEDASMRLRSLGLCEKRDSATSEVERELIRVQDERAVAYAGELAGHKAGFLQGAQHNILVTGSPDLVTPVQGDWHTIQVIAETLVGDQADYLYSWHKIAVQSLYSGVFMPGQMLVLAGVANCGKSFWQNRIVTPMLGGRCAKPLQYMTGKTTFNEDLCRAEHLMLEDENSNLDLKARREFGNNVKNYTVNVTQRLHPKGKKAFMGEVMHRMTLSVNNEPENLGILPILDDSITDKIMLLNCTHVFPFDTSDGKRREIEDRVKAELPAFIWFLLNEYEIPETIRDSRFGVKAYLDPELLDAINGLSPEEQLQSMIDEVFFGPESTDKVAVLTATEIQRRLAQHPDTEFAARKLFTYSNSCGIYLARLSSRHSPRVFKRVGHNKKIRWELTAAE